MQLYKHLHTSLPSATPPPPFCDVTILRTRMAWILKNPPFWGLRPLSLKSHDISERLIHEEMKVPFKAAALIALFIGLHFGFSSYKSSLLVEAEKLQAAQIKKQLHGGTESGSKKQWDLCLWLLLPQQELQVSYHHPTSATKTLLPCGVPEVWAFGVFPLLLSKYMAASKVRLLVVVNEV